MGRRSDFVRRPHDAYQTTDPRAVAALLPYITGVRTFAEPCCGAGELIFDLEKHGLVCLLRGDIESGCDALRITDWPNVDVIITNPPWTRQLLHPMILHFQKHRPTWLLFDSDWAYNVQAAPYLDQCSDIVAVGRLRWFNNTTGKDNASWYRFWHEHSGGPLFHPRIGGTMDTIVHTKEKPADLIAQYIELRNNMKAYDAEYAAAKKEAFDDPMNAIEGKLLALLNTMSTESIRTKQGTAYKKSFVSITTADGAAWRRHVIGEEAWDLVTFTPAKTAINDLIAENGGVLPPGLNRTVFLKVHVNSPKEKENSND